MSDHKACLCRLQLPSTIWRLAPEHAPGFDIIRSPCCHCTSLERASSEACKAAKTNYFLKLWKVPEPFFGIHTRSPGPPGSLCEGPSAINPHGGRYWVIFCLVQSKKFQEPQERLKFPEAGCLFCRIIQIFEEVAQNGGHFQNSRKCCLHTS